MQLNIRKSPEKEKVNNIVGTFKKGDKIEILGFSGKWAETKEGWISGSRLKIIDNKIARQIKIL